MTKLINQMTACACKQAGVERAGEPPQDGGRTLQVSILRVYRTVVSINPSVVTTGGGRAPGVERAGGPPQDGGRLR